jgi:glycosyltransferase involved in cell wall biosynthesis
MKLSFVIPAYNEEKYLPKCLEAVLKEKQKGKHDIEIIVVNNASTDNTRAVALSFGSDIIVVDEMKKGLAAARQAGFSASSGDLIANIDSDSILTPNWTDTVMSHFAKNSNLIALSGPFIYHDLSLISNLSVRIWYLLDYGLYIMHRFILRVGSHLQGGNYVIRKSALDQIGGFDQNFPFWGEDTHIAKQLNPLGPVVFTFKLPIYSSGRRLKKEGIFKMFYVYAANFFWAVFSDKPYTKDHYNEIRAEDFDKVAFKTTLTNFNKVLLYGKVAVVFVLFSLVGGTAYLYDRTVENIVPITASASALPVVDTHPILTKIHKQIQALEQKFDNDTN